MAGVRFLIPVVLAVAGLGAGVAAGIVFEPRTPAALPACDDLGARPIEPVVAPEPLAGEYVKIGNQLVVPLLRAGRVEALVVMSLSLEIDKGMGEEVTAREPKLLDSFLRVMFDHANSGGFDGEFTSNANLSRLRTSLREAAAAVLGTVVRDVLITDIVKRDS